MTLTQTLLAFALAAVGLLTDFTHMATRGMRPFVLGGIATVFIAGVSLPLLFVPYISSSLAGIRVEPLHGRVIAVGIPGAGPVTAVNNFLPGSPIRDKPEFASYTTPGKILDPARLLVGSISNFGIGPLANGSSGALLSLATDAPGVIKVPSDFARNGGQTSVQNDAIQLFSANSDAFLNRVNSPNAATADMPGVSNPLDISINNAFGRIWPGNAPGGLKTGGSSTILDPSGAPLAGAPSKTAGGVFFDSLTNRTPAQSIPGAISSGVVGTAFIGRSPENPARAVFVVVLADGSILQVNAEKGVDGLAPGGTVSDMRERRNADELHVGVVLKYYGPNPTLFVSDPVKNEIIAITLPKHESGIVRAAGTISRYASPAFDVPVDLAPTVPENASRDWSSNTTLAELADIYVLNRGNNTIVRMRDDGSVVSVRKVVLDKGLGGAKLNGITTSADGRKLYVTFTGALPDFAEEGGVIELNAFAK
jgi:hypothetical protein